MKQNNSKKKPVIHRLICEELVRSSYLKKKMIFFCFYLLIIFFCIAFEPFICKSCLFIIITDHFPHHTLSFQPFQTFQAASGFRSFQCTVKINLHTWKSPELKVDIKSALTCLCLFGNTEKHHHVAAVKRAQIQNLRIMIVEICILFVPVWNVWVEDEGSEGASFSYYPTFLVSWPENVVQ